VQPHIRGGGVRQFGPSLAWFVLDACRSRDCHSDLLSGFLRGTYSILMSSFGGVAVAQTSACCASACWTRVRFELSVELCCWQQPLLQLWDHSAQAQYPMDCLQVQGSPKDFQILSCINRPVDSTLGVCLHSTARQLYLGTVAMGATCGWCT
jgi:hypothetical protein